MKTTRTVKKQQLTIDLIWKKKKKLCTCSTIFFLISKKTTLRGQHTFLHISLPLFCMTKGDVIRDDSQRRFLAQHSVAILAHCCNHSKQCRNNVVMLCCAKNRRFESFRVTSPLKRQTSFNFLVLWRKRLCSCSLCFAAHFHLGSCWHFSFSHHRYIIVIFFFWQRNWFPLFFISRCSPFLVIHVNLDSKI